MAHSSGLLLTSLVLEDGYDKLCPWFLGVVKHAIKRGGMSDLAEE
jgi:hypothetical protein